MSFEEDGPTLVIDTRLPIYTDLDIVMAKVIFDLLIKFFEEEKPDEAFDLTTSSHEKEWNRLKAIYETVKSRDFFDDHLNPKVYEEVTNLMVEIVQLRYLLWT
jgi:hypothetical protein